MPTDSVNGAGATAAPLSPPREGRRLPRWLLPLFVSVAIVAWQASFTVAPRELSRDHKMSASMGLCADLPHFFYYFFHHFGVFPVGAAEAPELGPTQADAEKFVAEHGDRLKMDFGLPTNTPRFGDYGKLFLFWPDVLARGDPVNPSAVLFNEIVFIGALVALLWALWLEGHFLLGVLIVALVGSNPFQVFETYARGNIFSLPISIALLALAFHARFLSGRKGVDGPAWAIAILGGIALASFREVRAEVAFIGVSIVASYLLIRSTPLYRRALLVVAFTAAFAVTGKLWKDHWDRSFERAEQFVAAAGGQVYSAPRNQHHAMWHAVMSGLGDHGGDRGFSWDDRVGFRWATTHDPVLNPQPIPYRYVDGYYFEETFDGVHHIAPTDTPEYNALCRERVLRTIAEDPLWYGGILVKRATALLRDATPASLALGTHRVGFAWAGWLTLPILLVLLVRKERFLVKLVLFTLPLYAVALAIYSADGMTYYGIAHLVALAIGVDLARRALLAAKSRRPA